MSFTYDGFGNRTAQTVTKGSGPNIPLSYDATKNRITSSGYTYLSNGNLSAMPDAQGRAQTLEYDSLNRLSHYAVACTNEYYGYDHENRRVWKKNTQEEYYFYGALGELIGRYQKIRGTDCEFCEGFQVLARNVYFAGKLIRSQDGVAVVDRLGSVVGRNTDQTPYQTLRFYPFGEIQSEANGSTNRDKFATYFRDGSSNLDYAQNRYYSSRLGRFLTPDPFAGSASPANPLSWNRYAYVANDPINKNDPSGLILLSPMYFADKSMGEGWLEWLLKGPPQLTQHFYITDAIRKNHDHYPGAKLVEKALGVAKCAKALGFANSTAAVSKFLHTWINKKDLGSVGIEGPIYTYKYGAAKGGIIFINNNSAFDNLKAVPIPLEGAYPANVLADTESEFELKEGSVDESVFEAIYIAHELGHIGNGLKKDDDDKDLSIKNTKKVIESCFKDLKE